MKGTFDLRVLGCKVNQYDAQQIRTMLEQLDWQPATAQHPPDLLIVHTCAVTAPALRKSLQTARGLHRRYPQAKLILTGCGTAVPKTELPPEVCALVPPTPHLLQELVRTLNDLGLDSGTIADNEIQLQRFANHTRAFLKIQDGCDIGCSYCIVPSLRGKPRDRKASKIIEEAKKLSTQHREIVVSGISVGLYGRNSDNNLAQLLQELASLPQTSRLRLSSLHPNELTDELLAVWRNNPKIMPHIHLPLQSGSDKILSAMCRGYSCADFSTAVERCNNLLDQPTFTTDVIVGFPGETDADFEQTLTICRQTKFAKIHVFPYSPRIGTKAATFTNQISDTIKKTRAAQLRELSTVLAEQQLRSQRGRQTTVLVENWNDGICTGYTERYFSVNFSGAEELLGNVVPVMLDQPVRLADKKAARSSS